MELQERIEQALKEAIRQRAETKKDAVRMLLTAVKVREKEVKRQLGETEIQQVIGALVKQRRDSAAQFRQAGRLELAEKEEEEIAVLQEFLPRQLSPEELEEIVASAVAESGAKSEKEIGKVMKVLMPKVAGRADGKLVNELVRKLLAG